MSPRLKITKYVIERLSKIDTDEATGCLYGLMYDGTLLVIGLSIEFFENDKHTYKQLLLNLPAEVELCGIIKFTEGLCLDSHPKDILQDVDITDNPLVITTGRSDGMKAYFLVHDKLEETTYEVLEHEDFWKQFIHLRLSTVLPLQCEATIPGVKNILQSKRIKIASGQVSFCINGTSVYLFGEASDVGVTGSTNVDVNIGELIDSLNPEPNLKKKKNMINKVDIVPVSLVMRATKDILADKVVKTAVKMMTTQRKPAFCISMPLKVDTLAIVNRSTKLSDLYTVLVEAACRSLRLLECGLLEQLGQEGIGDGAGLRLPETFHFLPQELGHFVTKIVPKSIPDESMEKERLALHEQLALPLDRPIFRRGNAYSPSSSKLMNPHQAISQQLKAGVSVALVRGNYTYHHYMQDNFNDDGWGCAYRSMQTIFSWFRLQGYTTVDIPSHREIQHCLVKIGDKPNTFLGSKQWIGSTEVMFCLETLLGVQSRIIFANTGSELQSYTPELLHHFERHGSPIMIGGGVLAHTILGVEYNSEKNETRYLILDPHYTGADDLNVVISKGWCGWKTSDFWTKTAHYNLCLPQTKPCV